jgi:hypothetical protein
MPGETGKRREHGYERLIGRIDATELVVMGVSRLLEASMNRPRRPVTGIRNPPRWSNGINGLRVCFWRAGRISREHDAGPYGGTTFDSGAAQLGESLSAGPGIAQLAPETPRMYGILEVVCFLTAVP